MTNQRWEPMNRTNRIALMAAAVLVLVVSGTVFATRAPSAPSQPAQVTQDELNCLGR